MFKTLPLDRQVEAFPVVTLLLERESGGSCRPAAST